MTTRNAHPEGEHAVVLLSGGLDSAVTLADARSRGLVCHALSFDYGQRHRIELAAADRVGRAMGVASHVTANIDLRVFGGSALTADLAVPRDRDPAAAHEDIPITYVPARNLIFLAYAIAMAETRDAAAVCIGVNAIDYSGYPDCRPEFIAAFQRAANLGTKAGVNTAADRPAIRIETPLLHLSKADIIRRGAELGVDFSLTHSCYDPDPQGRACGHCDSCLLRRAGFEAAGVPDPTVYAD